MPNAILFCSGERTRRPIRRVTVLDTTPRKDDLGEVVHRRRKRGVRIRPEGCHVVIGTAPHDVRTGVSKGVDDPLSSSGIAHGAKYPTNLSVRSDKETYK